MDDTSRAAVAGYSRLWEAELAARYLEDHGIPAWVDEAGLDDPYRTPAGGFGLVRVFVPGGRADEAHALLAGMQPEQDLLEELAPEPPETPAEGPAGGEARWIRIVGFLVVAALAFAAVPHGLRIPAALLAGLGYMLWRLLRPLPPSSPGDD